MKEGKNERKNERTKERKNERKNERRKGIKPERRRGPAGREGVIDRAVGHVTAVLSVSISPWALGSIKTALPRPAHNNTSMLPLCAAIVPAH